MGDGGIVGGGGSSLKGYACRFLAWQNSPQGGLGL